MNSTDNASLNVLVIADYDPSVDWVQLSLQEQNYQIVGRADSVDQALQYLEQNQIDVLLADTSGDGVLDPGWIQRLAGLTSKVLILIIAGNSEMDFVREAMLVGAHGFLLKPFDLPELSRSIGQVHQLWLQRHALLTEHLPAAEAAAAPTKRGHAIATFSPKGGTGTTTLAVNLAIALKQQTNVPVLLADLDLRAADVDIFLSLFTKNSILDLIGLQQRIDKELLERVTTEHGSGIRVLRGDSQLQFIESPFEVGQIGDLVEQLVSIWDGYVVINTSNGLDRWTIETLDMADTILVVTTPELPSLRVTRNFLDLAEANVDESDKWHVIMNVYQGKKVLRTADIENSIKYPITATISEDFALVPLSINRGTPLITSHRKSATAADIMALAKKLIEANPKTSESKSTNSKSPSAQQYAASQANQPKRVAFWNVLANAVRPAAD
jgi:pilus assembly protein CpaE